MNPFLSQPMHALSRMFEGSPAPAPAPASGPTDAELVQGALAGRQDSFEQLVGRYQRRAFWIAYHVLGRIEDARDVVQEAFLRLHRGLESYDFGRNFYTWFYRIVMNLAIDSMRKWKSARTSSIEEFSGLLPAEAETSPTEQREISALVWRVLDRLDAKFKSVLVLRDIHGMSCREIAPILKVTHATVRWRLHRGRQIFREQWERLSKGWSE
jgi:RNA polymerase sigma-70 factor (ECF subfamily)